MKLWPQGQDLVGGIKNALMMPPGYGGEEATPEAIKAYNDEQAMNATVADIWNNKVTGAANKVAETTGADPNAIMYKLLENVPFMAAPIPIEFVGAPRVAATLSRLAQIGDATAKIAVANMPEYFVKGSAIAVAAHGLGMPAEWLHLGEMAGGALGFKASQPIGRVIVKAISGKTPAEITEMQRLVLEAPGGVQAMDAIRKPVADQINVLNRQVKAMSRRLSPDDLADLAEKIQGTNDPLYPSDDLTGMAKRVRAKQEQMADLTEKLDRMGRQSAFHKWTNATASYAANMAANTAIAGGIGGLLGAATAPTGMGGEGLVQGSMFGAGIGAAFAPFAAASGMHNLRMARGRNALIEMGSRGFDMNSIAGLTDYWRKQVLMANGYAGAMDGQIKVVDPANAPFQWPGAVPQGAPAGAAAMTANGVISPDGRTIYLNKNSIGEGTAYHELRHMMQRFTGQMLRLKAPEIMAPFEEAYAVAAGTDKFNTQAEMDAEIGRIAMMHTPIEGFYGGKTPGDVLGRIARGIVNWGVPDKITLDGKLRAPFNQAYIAKLHDQMFKLGEITQARRFREPVIDSGAGAAPAGGGAHRLDGAAASDLWEARRRLLEVDPAPLARAVAQPQRLPPRALPLPRQRQHPPWFIQITRRSGRRPRTRCG
jgi:hypothetical protein